MILILGEEGIETGRPSGAGVGVEWSAKSLSKPVFEEGAGCGSW